MGRYSENVMKGILAVCKTGTCWIFDSKSDHLMVLLKG